MQTREAKHLRNACQWQKHSRITPAEWLLFVFTDDKHVYFPKLADPVLETSAYLLDKLQRWREWIPLQVTGKWTEESPSGSHTSARVGRAGLLWLCFFKFTRRLRVRVFETRMIVSFKLLGNRNERSGAVIFADVSALSLKTALRSVNTTLQFIISPRRKCQGQKTPPKPQTHLFFGVEVINSTLHANNIPYTHTHTHMLSHTPTHTVTLHSQHAVPRRSWGIDKLLRPESGAEVGLIEMNFRGRKGLDWGEGPN